MHSAWTLQTGRCHLPNCCWDRGGMWGSAVGRLWNKSHLLPLRPVTGDHAALTGDHTAPSGGGVTERAVHVCPAQARKLSLVTKAPGLGRKVLQASKGAAQLQVAQVVFPGLSMRGFGMAGGPRRTEGN